MRVLWTPKSRLLLAASLLLYLGAAVNEQPVMYFMASAAAAVLLVCFSTAKTGGRTTECERRVGATRAVEGTAIPVHTVLRHPGRLPLFGASIREQSQNVTLDRREPLAYTAPLVEPRGVHRQTTAVDVPTRGRYRFGPVSLVVPDPLGLFEGTREIPSEATVIVLPRTFRMDPAVLAHAPAMGAQGTSRPVAVGAETEVSGVREFMHGDDLRRVHWNSTARTGRLMVKQIDSHLSTSLTIILDLCHEQVRPMSDDSTDTPDSTLEQAVRVAASLAERALADGHLMRLICHEGQRLSLPLDRGPIQFQRIMDTLAVVRGQGGLALPELLRLEQMSVLPRSTAAIITASPDVKVAEAVTSLRRRNVRVIFVSVVGTEDLQELAESDRRPGASRLRADPLTSVGGPKPQEDSRTSRPARDGYAALMNALKAVGCDVVQIANPGEAEAAFAVQFRSRTGWAMIA